MVLMASIQTNSVHRQTRDTHLGGSKRDGSYLVKESYLHLTSRKTLTDLWPWKLIWRTKMPPKVICFSWVSLNGSCLTHDNIMRMKFCLANRCYMCSCNPKSINHLFLHCSVTTDLWNMFFSLFGLAWAMPGSLREAFVCWSSWEVHQKDLVFGSCLYFVVLMDKEEQMVF
ncbi:hypothetical protein MTR67_028855 [Solanum verrucosum]|uniref:Reverse transcriptase zinc-binding domain-containing protein n=1 Tax=Solanum verrucosum TaxID=315347 RepID=A0AAF0U046_SOLVR|nr:hypothetical protein MTR67_028855 [Solanum verrucosum]